MKHITDKILLITGGTGSWGHALVRELLALGKKGPREIRIYSRGEHKQVEMKIEFPDPRIQFIIGDVRDKNILHFALRDVQTVFHLAALKHVSICDDNPWESVLTNINGTQNVIECAIENNCEVVVDVSTDKAVEPFNFYGMTKACGERLVTNATKFNTQTKFVCVRGGNVIATNGSVIPLFKKLLAEHKPLTITDPAMTRFLISGKKAIQLLFSALEYSEGGEIFVLKMKATSLEKLVQVLIQLYGDSKSELVVVGPRSGEKLDEVLISKHEAPFTEEKNDELFVIHPQGKAAKIAKPVKFSEFTSRNTKQFSDEELLELIRVES